MLHHYYLKMFGGMTKNETLDTIIILYVPELAVEKTIDLFLERQNWFLSKEIWVRPMSSSTASTNGL